MRAGFRCALGWLIALSVLTGCAGRQPATTLYQDLGGEAGVDAIVEGLVVRIVEDPRIGHHFVETDLIDLHAKLVEQICFEADGPCQYTGLSMTDAHAGRNITEADFNALVEGLLDSMDEQGVPVSAQNRLLARLAPMRPEIIHQ